MVFRTLSVEEFEKSQNWQKEYFEKYHKEEDKEFEIIFKYSLNSSLVICRCPNCYERNNEIILRKEV